MRMSSSEKLRKRLKLLLRSRSRRRSWTSRMSLNQSAQCSATCRIRAVCRGFRSRRVVGKIRRNRTARMPDAQSTMSMAAREKKHYGLLQKTVPENNHKTQCRCVCHVSLYLAWVHTGNTFQSLILGQYRCSSSPCRYRGAGWIPRYWPRTRAGTCTSPELQRRHLKAKTARSDPVTSTF